MIDRNLALRRPALQSSTSYLSTDRTPAIDASVATSGDLESTKYIHTGEDLFPWWQVDLGEAMRIHRVEIANRVDQPERLTCFTLLGSLDAQTWAPLHRARVAPASHYTLDLKAPRLARFLRVRLDGRGPLHFRQALVFGEPGDSASEREAYAEVARRRAARPEGRNGEIVRIDAFELFADADYAAIIQQQLRNGAYERRERELICRLLKPDDRVLELGTAIGLAAMTAAAIVGAENVVSFDANPAMIADAAYNFARNGLPIEARAGALVARTQWRAGQRLAFHVAADFWASRLVSEDQGGSHTIEVDAFCFEDEVARTGANVLICDIEGGEVELLGHADLSPFRLIVLETHYWAAGRSATDALFRKLILDGFALDLEVSGQQVLALRREVSPGVRNGEERVNILTICGSVRRGSVNAAALRAAMQEAPSSVRVSGYAGLDQLPHFNPDTDVKPLPTAVAALRESLASADAVLFSTPEYAGSLPGAFKNLLDWTVGGACLYGRPVGWINPSAHGGSRNAFSDLARVLARAGAEIVEAACLDIPIERNQVDASGGIADASIRARLRGALCALADEAWRRQERASPDTDRAIS